MQNKWFKILIGFLIILVVLIVQAGDSKEDIYKVETAKELTKLLKEEVIIIDIRTASEYEESHIPRSINIPYTSLKEKVVYDKNAKIIVYSKNDSRSHLAALQLKQMDYKNIYEVDMNTYKGKLVTS